MDHLAPMATMSGANGCSIVANGDLVSGANGDIHWQQWRSPLATIGAIEMAPLDPLDGDTQFTITIQSEWIIWRSNGIN